ncbi:MAG: sigma-70 family RNA polymerase sigma factor [Muribaculaceae bacterium]|nr:sigma-70 family RNA polymerase sigma factor [Muribaculaceae bacterium]
MAALPPIDEKQLIKQLQDPKESRTAFDMLMRAYGEKIYWQIRRMVVNHDDASDLLQNTFIKAWNNVDNFRGDAKLSTWLYKIAVNESLNFLQRERSRQGISIDDDSQDTFVVRQLEADDYFDGDALKLELQKAIAELPERQRLVFNMRYFEEMKYEQISEVLGTSVGALKASYHHAVKKIEKHFLGEGS